MPFTPTHVLAVIPFWPLRRWLPLVGLAIGAMIPDIAMFFPMVDYAQTHSPLGVFSTCLPIGAAVFLLFEAVMRRPLLALLPAWFQHRINSHPQLPMTPRLAAHFLFYAGIGVAIIIGAFTHQIWDAFTHQGRWGTQVAPVLNTTVSIAGYEVAGYKLFQYGSTIIGLPLLTTLALIILSRAPATHACTTAIPHWMKVTFVFLGCLVPVLVGANALSTQATSYQALGVTIRNSGAIMSVLCVTYCFGFQLLVSRNGNT